MVINDFSGEGVPVDEFMKANTNRAKGRTFLYAIETKMDRVTRQARGKKEPVVLKFGRSNGLGRLANYWIEFGSSQNSPLHGAYIMGLQDVGPTKPDDLQGEKRSHVTETALHRLARSRAPEDKKRDRGKEWHTFSSMEDAYDVFNDDSIKRIRVNNAPARRSERAKTTRDCVQYGIFKDGEGLLRYEAAPGMEGLLNPRPARWF